MIGLTHVPRWPLDSGGEKMFFSFPSFFVCCNFWMAREAKEKKKRGGGEGFTFTAAPVH